MRLDYLKIDSFKNLNNFEVDFEETAGEPVTVLLGRNGSGKSNLIEALVIIFRDLNKVRPLFYAKPIHSNFALLAFFMTEDAEVSEFLSDYPWIEGLESALFVLKRPHWAKNKRPRPGGDPRFWYAGGIVKEFLSSVYDCA